jgi:hypothetical protein
MDQPQRIPIAADLGLIAVPKATSAGQHGRATAGGDFDTFDPVGGDCAFYDGRLSERIQLLGRLPGKQLLSPPRFAKSFHEPGCGNRDLELPCLRQYLELLERHCRATFAEGYLALGNSCMEKPRETLLRPPA